ncbi:hypothetical protein AW27_026285 [Streptomyces sp. PCS3-D2]|uniref:hypothetical protein n=1 Tax=Streptomyces sp. PCS3-D2 TaxID=1460244 RepID=UPI00055A82BB
MICTTCGAEAVVQWRRRTPDKRATEPVGGCADHAMTPAAAGYVHEATCPGPGKSCGCPAPATPEFPFTGNEDRPGGPPKRRMPPGW